MNLSTLQRGVAAALFAGAMAAPAFAAGSGNASYDTYRHVVLGDTQAPVADQARFDEFSPRLLTSGYARYLLNNGQSARSVQQTAAASDVAVTRLPAIDDSRLTSYQRYERSLGQDVKPSGDALSASRRSDTLTR